MSRQSVKPGQVIQCGEYLINVGGANRSEVYISYKRNQNPVGIAAFDKGGALDLIRKKFKRKLASDTFLFFRIMSADDIFAMEDILKSRNKIEI